MRSKLLLLFTCLIGLANRSSAQQTSYLPGYVVRVQGDTLRGYLSKKLPARWADDTLYVKVNQSDNSPQRLPATAITAYAIEEEGLFRAKPIRVNGRWRKIGPLQSGQDIVTSIDTSTRTKFLKQWSNGAIRLYELQESAYGRLYFLERNNDRLFVNTNSIEAIADFLALANPNPVQQGYLQALKKEYTIPVLRSLINTLDPNNESANDQSLAIFEKRSLVFVPKVGFSQLRMTFRDERPYTNLVFAPTFTPVVGVGFGMPSRNRKLSIWYEVMYSQRNASVNKAGDFVSGKGGYLRFNSHWLGVNMLLHYRIARLKTTSLSLQVGGFGSYALSNRLQQDIPQIAYVNKSQSPFEFGGIVGLNAKMNRFHVDVRYSLSQLSLPLYFLGERIVHFGGVQCLVGWQFNK